MPREGFSRKRRNNRNVPGHIRAKLQARRSRDRLNLIHLWRVTKTDSPECLKAWPHASHSLHRFAQHDNKPKPGGKLPATIQYRP